MAIIKLIKIALLITAIQSTIGASCKKNDTKPCVNSNRYAFTVTSEFSPQEEVYNIGDTIILTSVFSKTLTDLISNQQIDYKNSVGIRGTIAFTLLDTANRTFIESYSKFTVLPIKGSFNNSTIVSEIGVVTTYLESSEYELMISISFKQKGIYWINVTDLFSKGIMGQECTNAGFGMKVTNTNKHFSLFQFALGYPADALQINNGYCFRVQ